MKTTRPPAPKSPEPKRSLSAYNLFYRYKRAKILELSGPGGPGGFAAEPSRRAIDATLAAALGLEDYPSIAAASPLNDEEAVQYLRRCEIKSVLGRHPRPSSADARSRRRGPVGFLEMNKRTVAAWRDVDAFAREVLEDLAAEGARRHKARPSGLRERTRIPRAKAGNKGEEPKAKATGKRKKGPEEGEEDVQKAEEGAQKEPARPKRPLTAYNLFYRFKRDKILEAHKRGLHSNAAIDDLIAAVVGLEGHLHVHPDLSSKPVRDLRRSAIRSSMADNLVPKGVTRRRAHRKSHGAMSFLEMGRRMSASWNATDDFGREVFTELAEEGRAIYQEKVQAYEREAEEAKARAPRDGTAKEKAPKPPKKAAKKPAAKKAGKKPSARKARASAKPKKKASTLTPKLKAKRPPVEELVFSLDDTSIVTPLSDAPLSPGLKFHDPAVVTPPGATKPHARYAALEDHQWYPPPPQLAPGAYSSYPYAYPGGYDVSPTEVQAPFYPELMPLFPDIFDMDEEDAHMLAHCVSGEVGSDELDSLEAAAAELPEASVEGIAANASFDDFVELVAALD